MTILRTQYLWRYIIAIGAAIAALVGIAQWYMGPVVPVFVVQRSQLTQRLAASGHVESPHRIELGSVVTGIAHAVAVVEGETVKKGQLLIRLQGFELAAGVDEAALAVVQAKARVRQLREVQMPLATETLKQAELNQSVAHDALQRSLDLFRQGFVSQSNVDEANRTAQAQSSLVNNARMQALSSRTGGSDRAIADIAVLQAQANVVMASARLANSRIVAPSAGTVIQRMLEPGDVVMPGKVLMVLSTTGPTELLIWLDEKHLRLLQLGQPAIVTADASPQTTLKAVLTSLSPAVDLQRGSVLVKLLVHEPPGYLRQDMTVSVEIEVQHRDATLIIKTDTVHDLATTVPWVLRVRNGRLERVNIRLGLVVNDKCEVLEGLSMGDQLVSAHTPLAKTIEPLDHVRIGLKSL